MQQKCCNMLHRDSGNIQMLSDTMTLFTMEECNVMFHLITCEQLFFIATPGRARRTGSVPLRAVQASAKMSAIGGVSAPPPGTAVAGSCRKELLRAMLAAMANIWPQRRRKHVPMQGGTRGPRRALSPARCCAKYSGVAK